MQIFLSTREGQRSVLVFVIALASLLLDSHNGNDWFYQQTGVKVGRYCKSWMKLSIKVLNESNSKVTLNCWWKQFVRSKDAIQSFFQSLMILFLLCHLMQTLKFSLLGDKVNSVAYTLARAVNSWTSFHRFEILWFSPTV
jgi:hypothetical protein